MNGIVISMDNEEKKVKWQHGQSFRWTTQYVKQLKFQQGTVNGRQRNASETPAWHSHFDGRRSKPIEMPALLCHVDGRRRKTSEILTWHRHFE